MGASISAAAHTAATARCARRVVTELVVVVVVVVVVLPLVVARRPVLLSASAAAVERRAVLTGCCCRAVACSGIFTALQTIRLRGLPANGARNELVWAKTFRCIVVFRRCSLERLLLVCRKVIQAVHTRHYTTVVLGERRAGQQGSGSQIPI